MDVVATLEKEALHVAVTMLERSQCNISGSKIGASVIARNKNGDYKIFGGCNIEWATSLALHAERVAMINAISEGYTFPELVCVTAVGGVTPIPLCGYCRQDYMYLNPECQIIVVKPADETEMMRIKLIDTLKFPYLSKGKIDVSIK